MHRQIKATKKAVRAADVCAAPSPADEKYPHVTTPLAGVSLVTPKLATNKRPNDGTLDLESQERDTSSGEDSEARVISRSSGASSFLSRRRARLLTSAGRLPTPSSPLTPQISSTQSPLRQPELIASMPAPLREEAIERPSVTDKKTDLTVPEARVRRPLLRTRKAPSLPRLMMGGCILLALLLLTGIWTAFLVSPS